MATVGQIHAQNSVTGLQQRQKHRKVRLRTRVGLNIGMRRAKQFLHPVDC